MLVSLQHLFKGQFKSLQKRVFLNNFSQKPFGVQSGKSFIEIKDGSHFPLENLPFGVFECGESFQGKKLGVAIGDQILDLQSLLDNGFLSFLSVQQRQSLREQSLNSFFSLSRKERSLIRSEIQSLLKVGSPLHSRVSSLDSFFFPQEKVTMRLPVEIGDYTDFYASRNHAENVGEMFRGPENKLMPNWLHMPIGYHGRSSSVNVEKTVIRPAGQIDLGVFGLENKLDLELEMAVLISGKGNQMGNPLKIEDSGEAVGGFCLMNDLSARSIQRIEYVPLGPFLGKNFSTVISPWVVLPDALEQFVEERNFQEKVVDYLQIKNKKNKFYDIPLQVYLQPRGEKQRFLISESNMNNLYWSFEQMIAHHTISGCNLRTGDMIASGTISGNDKEKSSGSLLEISWNGTKPLKLPNGDKRTFLEDGDTIILTGGKKIPGTNSFIGFGEVSTTILPRKI